MDGGFRGYALGDQVELWDAFYFVVLLRCLKVRGT